jgi:hypothetical protein
MDVVKNRCMVNMPVYSMQLDIDNDQLIKDIKHHRENFPEGEESNVKAWRSSYKTHEQTRLFDPYIHKILEGAERARRCDPDFFSCLPYCTYTVHDFWALMYEEGDYTQRHTHYPITWASCYYAYADEDAAPIRFDTLRIKPKSGTLLLWHGSLFHSVPKTQGKRIAVSANLIIKDWG